MSKPTQPALPSPSAKTTTLPKSFNEVKELVRRAEGGDQSALPAVRELLCNPQATESLGGNLARGAETILLAAFCGKNLMLREAVTRKMQDLRAELSGPDPTPIERLLAERAVGCWLHLHHLETIRAGKTSMDISLALYYEKAIDRAQKRYLSALKALAEVRKLALPVIQVNVAKKQVNMAGAVATAS